jgi:hypothetical protein
MDLKVLESFLGAETPDKGLESVCRFVRICRCLRKRFWQYCAGKRRDPLPKGIWESDTEDESSNFWEFENVVCALEAEAPKGAFDGAIIFMCTDNSTVDTALTKRKSSSRKLYELMLRVQLLEMRHSCRIIVLHVTGKRMKAQGTDGVSRGQMNYGVTTGRDMMTFIPFHHSAIQRLPGVRDSKGRLELGIGLLHS